MFLWVTEQCTHTQKPDYMNLIHIMYYFICSYDCNTVFIILHQMLVASLPVHLWFYLTQQHLKGLSVFEMRGHLTDSTAQKKKSTECKRSRISASQTASGCCSSLACFFSVDVKWKVYEARQWREESRAAEGIVRRGVKWPKLKM